MIKAVAARRWDDYYPGGQWLYFPADHDGEKLCLKSDVDRLARYLTHDVGCKANDLDYLDHTPCTCGLRALYNPKGTRMPEEEVKQYMVGDHTMAKVFKPAGLTDVHDLQAVFDAVEKALTPPEDAGTEGIRVAAKTIRDWMPTTLPADEQGKLHFARVIAEAAANEIEKYIASKGRDIHSTLADLRKLVDTMEARSMACDGPVTPFLEEIHVASDVEKERFMVILRALYAASTDRNEMRRKIESVLSIPSSGHASAGELAETILDALGIADDR